MCYRIFRKPPTAKDWFRASEHASLPEALEVMDHLLDDHVHNAGDWVLRDIKGCQLSRIHVAALPQASTSWTTPWAQAI